MRIAICDDMPELRTELKNALKKGNYLKLEDQLVEYQSAKELLEQLTEQKPALLFLDIEMPGMSGIELLRQHLFQFRGIKVVILTSHMEYLPEGYKLNIYRYMQKPVRQDELDELFRAISLENMYQRSISIQSHGITYSLIVEEILYVEVYNNYCSIVTRNDTLKYYARLKELRTILTDDCFYQANRSYLINMLHIKHTDWQTGEVVMSDGICLNISRSHRKEFQQVYLNFVTSI